MRFINIILSGVAGFCSIGFGPRVDAQVTFSLSDASFADTTEESSGLATFDPAPSTEILLTDEDPSYSQGSIERLVLDKENLRSLRFKDRTPAMIGDFFGGSHWRFGANSVIDRAFIVADDLDVPLVLPGAGSVLSISETGPIGIFSGSVTKIQELQALLRAGQPLSGVNLIGTLPDDATLTTALTVGDIQSQLGNAVLPYTIIALAPPPAAYDAAVNAIFSANNALPGTTVYLAPSSGAFTQGGVNSINGGDDLDAYYFYEYRMRVDTRLIDAASGGVGRVKIAEGGTVLPQTRTFLHYGHFHNVAYGNTRVALNRFTPGFERAFADGLFSVEVRAPIAADARALSTWDGDRMNASGEVRFGNLTTYLKTLLFDRGPLAVSAGLGIAAPTASDLRVRLPDDTEVLRVANDAVHLHPFAGALFTPNERFFAHGFLQWDLAAGSNRVLLAGDNNMMTAGRMNDPNHLLVSVGLGTWLYKSQARRGLTGVIPMLEVHHANSIDRGQAMISGPIEVGNYSGTMSMTSVVAGTTFEYSRRTHLTLGYGTALTNGEGRQYDGAFRASLQRGW
ncbi:hypothetical protein SH449x_000814 [Pirellulaceae bacterium SH449]